MDKIPEKLQKAVTLLEAVFHGFKAEINKDSYAYHKQRLCTIWKLERTKLEKPVIIHNGMRLHEFIDLAGQMTNDQHDILQKGIILSKALRSEQ